MNRGRVFPLRGRCRAPDDDLPVTRSADATFDAPSPAASSTLLISVISALPEELSPLLKRAAIHERTRVGDHHVYWGTLGGTLVVMTSTGAGRFRAGWGARSLLDISRPSALVGIGLAGALSPGLGAGSLLVGSRVFDRDARAPSPHEAALSRAIRTLEGVGGVVGTLVTVDKVLCSAEEKKSLLAALGEAEPAAVDLESAPWARAAARRGIPFVIVRAILDEASEDLPEFIARSLGAGGAVSKTGILRYALLRPRAVGQLRTMRKRLQLCAERLAVFVEEYVRESA